MLPLICNQAESAPYVLCAHTRTRTYIRIYARTLSAIDMCYVRMYTIRLRALMNTQSKFHIYIPSGGVRILTRVCTCKAIRICEHIQPVIFSYTHIYARICRHTRICMHAYMHAYARPCGHHAYKCAYAGSPLSETEIALRYTTPAHNKCGSDRTPKSHGVRLLGRSIRYAFIMSRLVC